MMVGCIGIKDQIILLETQRKGEAMLPAMLYA
jgi:hypothetical protein